MKKCNRIPLNDNESFASELDKDTQALLALSGTWEDDRSIETIIQDIYESRAGSNLEYRNLDEHWTCGDDEDLCIMKTIISSFLLCSIIYTVPGNARWHIWK